MAAPTGGQPAPDPKLKPSAYERASAAVLSLLVFVGVLVACLLTIWLSHWRHGEAGLSVPVQFERGGGDPAGMPGERLDVEGPQRLEIGPPDEPVESRLEKTMAAIADVVVRKIADLDQPLEDAASNAAGGGVEGEGRKRPKGDGPGPDGVPVPIWQMRYDESTLDVYAQQLDFFGIELAVVGGEKDRIEYASGFTRSPPARRTGTRVEELQASRTYFTHQSGTVRQYDQQLLSRASIKTDGKLILQYYAKAVVQELLALEKNYRGLDRHDILSTVFGVRRRGSGFEFYVLDQVRR
jgi:hypothetical protein